MIVEKASFKGGGLFLETNRIFEYEQELRMSYYFEFITIINLYFVSKDLIQLQIRDCRKVVKLLTIDKFSTTNHWLAHTTLKVSVV